MHAMDAESLPKNLRPHADKLIDYSGPANGDEGHWLTLAPEWFSPEMGCRTIHEYSLRDCLRMLRNIEPAA
jgi:hypothetical protein